MNPWTGNGPGTQWWEYAPCGSEATHRRHIRHGEQIDNLCRNEHTRRVAEWKKNNPEKVRAQAARHRARRRASLDELSPTRRIENANEEGCTGGDTNEKVA